MHLLKFKVKLKSDKKTSEIIDLVNNTLDLNIDKFPYQQGKHWMDWKCNSFGLEITITYFAQKENYSISGYRTEKIASMIPLDEELIETNISTELLGIFKLSAPEDEWFIE